ncbi:MAG: ABC transporter permease [Pseudomonadota bacterium]
MSSNPMPSFINIRVIVALMMREMTTRYGKSAGGYVWALLEPIGMIAVLVIVFSQALRSPQLGDSFPLFFATGYIAFGFYGELSNFASAAIAMNKPLLTLPRVTPIDAILARFLLQFITLCVTGVIILSGIMWIEDIHTVIDYASILKAIGYASILGLGVGITNVVIFSFVPTYQNVWKIITRPMFLISGVFFIMEDLPGPLQDILWWNPVIHATGLMRKGFFPLYDANFVSELYIGGLGFGFLTLGLFLVYSNRSFIVDRP